MPSGKQLTAEERSFIEGPSVADNGQQRTLQQVQQLLQRRTGQRRSLKVISSFLKDPAAYGTGCGSDRLQRTVVKAALDNPARGVRGVASILSSSVTSISKSQVHNILTSNQHVVLVKSKPKPPLTAAHRDRRLRWAEATIREAVDFSKVIWTDENRFNLDGPDYFNYYWHDLRQQQPQRIARRLGGGGLMVWAAFSAAGIHCIVKVDGTLNAVKYQQLLTETAASAAQEAPGTSPTHSAAGQRQSTFCEVDTGIPSPSLSSCDGLASSLTRPQPNRKRLGLHGSAAVQREPAVRVSAAAGDGSV